MLGKIVFLIWDKKLLERAVEWKRGMDAGSDAVHIWGRGEEGKGRGEGWDGDGTSVGREAGCEEAFGCRIGQWKRKEEMAREPKCLEAYERESTLFITDKGVILRELQRQGRHVIALLYEGNEKEDFAGATYAVTDMEQLSMDSFDQAFRRMAGLPWIILETPRCIVRETTVEDVEEFYRIYAEPSITEYMDMLYATPEEERAYTEEYQRCVYGFYGYGMWSIVQKDSNRVIGRAGLSWREGFNLPEIGFMIEVPCQRKGYAYEVCRAIMEYGREELGFGEIQALVEPGNVASAKLCAKLGMEWRDRVEDGGKVYERFIGR